MAGRFRRCHSASSAAMKIVPIVLSVLVLVATVWRWRLLTSPIRVAGLAISGALVLYGTGVLDVPELDTVVARVGSTLGPYTYLLVAVMAFLETGAFVGLLVPGETVVIVGGVVAGQGHIDLLALLGVTWIFALTGDVTGYALGRRLGRRFLLKHGPRAHLTEARLIRIEGFFTRYGLATILIGRFVGLVRPVAPFLAGASRYSAGRFLALAVLGTGVWSTAFVLLGYIFWESFDHAVTIAKRGSLGLVAIVLLAVALVALQRRLRGRGSEGRDSAGSQRRSPTPPEKRARTCWLRWSFTPRSGSTRW